MNNISFPANNFLTNSFNSVNKPASIHRFWILVFIGVLVFAIVGGVYVWLQKARNIPSTADQTESSIMKKESWCFVGEDVKGRWCLQVPSDHACDPNRTFASRSECELVEASSLPLGVVQNGGATMQPLGPMPSMSSTL